MKFPLASNRLAVARVPELTPPTLAECEAFLAVLVGE